MRLIPSVVGVVLVAFFGNVKAAPGILDYFNFGTPQVRTVYVVKPSHGQHGHRSPLSHSSGHSSKTIIKYVSKPPPSSHISPFSIFSNPFSSGSSSGWGSSSSGSRGKGRKPTSMVINKQMFKNLVEGGGEEGKEEDEAAGPMSEDVMNQMLSSTRGAGQQGFESEDSDSQVEIVNRPQSQNNMRGMRPPSTSSMAMNQGERYSNPQSQKTRSQASRARPRPSQPRPEMMMMNPPMFEQGLMNEVEESMPVRGHSSSESNGKPSKFRNSKGKGSGSSSSGGWSSDGPPTTITYITKGWGGSSSGGGWGGWSPPSSSGWGSSFDDDEWSYGGGDSWSPSSPSSGGWSSDSEAPEAAGESEGQAEEEGEAPGTGGPVVEEVDTTEEGEDRRPMTSSKRPSTSQNENRRPAQAPRRPTSSSNSRPTSNSNRPAQSLPVTASTSEPPMKTRPKPSGRKLPKTNEPQPDDYEPQSERQRPVSPNVSDSPRPVYGVPIPSIQSQSSGSGSSVSGQLRIGDQVISNNDGLLDEELMRTVQQIIQTFDKN